VCCDESSGRRTSGTMTLRNSLQNVTGLCLRMSSLLLKLRKLRRVVLWIERWQYMRVGRLGGSDGCVNANNKAFRALRVLLVCTCEYVLTVHWRSAVGCSSRGS
jgi:hypothetical protein